MKASKPTMTNREMILFGAVMILASTSIALFINAMNPWHGPGPRPMPGMSQPYGSHHSGDKNRKDFGEHMFLKADADKDGFLTKEEMIEGHRQFVEKMFTESDADKDGKLSADEMKQGRDNLRKKMWEERKAQAENGQEPR